MSETRFYVTTAIDYPNGKPHLGHAYEKICADAYARWYRMLGREVFFLTGTDENGQKLSKSAADLGKQTREFVSENSDSFRKFCADLLISNDDFIRTTEDRHIRVCHELWQILEKKGDIYFGQYEGNYCLSCEAFYPENQAPDGKCPTHGIDLNFMKEEGYFFKMSQYHHWIVNHLKSNAHFVTPESSRKEILSRLESEPLRDLSISRPNQGWGIEVPGNPKHVIYTWFDALINYYSAILHDPAKVAFWPAQLHIIGRDIAWFHTVIWPIMLHAAKIALPEQVYVHGMLLAEDGRKMSKSLGNAVDPYDVVGVVPVESFRFYLLRAISSQQDGKFSVKEVIEKHNTELANDYGNLLMRVVKLAQKKTGNQLSPGSVDSADFGFIFEKMKLSMDRREHHRALEVLWDQIKSTNVFVNDQAPWKIADLQQFQSVAYACVHSIWAAAILMSPFMPGIAAQVLSFLGHTLPEGPVTVELLRSRPIFVLTEPTPLFPKIEAPKV